MALDSRLLASGPGWGVSDIVCSAGPHDRPIEERHDAVCIAAVTQGTFQYRSTLGAAVLAPGAVLLGNEGTCFECGHEHGAGDRCLSFHFAPDYLESIVAAVPGVRRTGFTVPRLPPLPCLMPLLAAAEAARDDGDGAELEELALRLGGVVAAALVGAGKSERSPSSRDARRVTGALRRIEAEAHEHLALADLAREAAMSPYHFLRTFCQVVGMTPHQFVLRTRLHRAAVRLRRSDEAVSAIAFDMGFNDLSTFNRRFRRVMGSSPSAYRAAGSRRGFAGSNRDRATATNGLVHWRQNPHDRTIRPGVPRRRG
jgi:AraC family transcriptional regulator